MSYISRLSKKIQLNAITITVIYLVTGTLWILFSSKVLSNFVDDIELLSKFESIKGIFYVLATGGLLYYLIETANNKFQSENNIIEEALHSVRMATWSINLRTKKNTTSKDHYKLFGLKENPDQWELSDFYEFVHPEDIESVKKAFTEAIDTGTPYRAEYRIIWRDGTVRWMRSRGTVQRDEDGDKKSISGIVSDITEQKEMEEEYARDKELFESIFENIPVMVDLYDPKTNKIRVNKTCENILGWSNAEIQEIDLMKECYPDPKIREKALEEMEKGTGEWHEFEVRNKAGEKRIQSWSNIRLSDDTIVGIGLDVTELRASQAEIRESQELLKKTFESLTESVIILDPETRTITDCNKITFEIFGYTAEELIGSSTKKLHVSEAKFHEFGELGKEDLKSDGVFQCEFVMKRKDGSHFYSDHTVTLVRNEKDEIEKIVSVVRDITETKKQEKELQDLANRYRTAEKIARIGHWERNIEADKAIWSDGFYEIIGIEKRAKAPSYQDLLEMIHPGDREEYDEAFKEALETGSLNIRYRIIKPDTGEVGYYQELAKTMYDKDGTPVSISGTIQDMTEQEEFQIKLKQRNDFIETTIENLPIGVAVNLIDEGTVTLMNSKFTQIYGWPKDVLTDVESYFSKVYPDENYRQKIVEMISADIASEDPGRMQWKDIRIETQSGEERIVNAKNIPVYDQNLMISTVVDVTAQFKAEQRLADSEHNYRLLFQKSPQPMWIYNPENLLIIEVNNAAIKHYGYTRKEFSQMTLLDIRPEQDHENLRKNILGQKSEQISESGEWRHCKKNGDLIYVKVTGSSINYFGNEYRLVLVNDITQQKKAEEIALASLVEGENKERARIAQELHDGLGQYLAAANMNLDAVSSDTDKLNERRQQQFEKGLNLLKHAINETAQISRNLLPRVVNDYGLVLAIEALVDNYSNNTDTEITYYQNIDKMELPQEVEFNLYRIAQEAISNAVKYAGASQINVQLIKDELDLSLTIDDNGKGFDVSAKDFSPGLGLQTIKIRAGALGGEFDLDSKPGGGTFINVIVPLDN